eukprot:scaffold16638_cov120-Isochrysis_galbana.AAC.4
MRNAEARNCTSAAEMASVAAWMGGRLARKAGAWLGGKMAGPTIPRTGGRFSACGSAEAIEVRDARTTEARLCGDGAMPLASRLVIRSSFALSSAMDRWSPSWPSFSSSCMASTMLSIEFARDMPLTTSAHAVHSRCMAHSRTRGGE